MYFKMQVTIPLKPKSATLRECMGDAKGKKINNVGVQSCMQTAN